MKFKSIYIFVIIAVAMLFLTTNAMAKEKTEVTVINDTTQPVPVTVQNQVTIPTAITVDNDETSPVPTATANPGLPKHPIHAFVNAEDGSDPILFGPYSSDTKIAIGSLTFDGGNATFGSQIQLSITNCDGGVLQIVGIFMVRNWAAGLGPQHMSFPVPIVLPLQNPGQNWCLQAFSYYDDQILITAVGYLVE